MGFVGARRAILLDTYASDGDGPAPTPSMAMDAVIAPSTTEGATGTVLTVAKMNTATKGTNPGTWSLIGFGGPSSLTYTKLGVAASAPLPVALEVGGNLYYGDETDARSIEYDCENPAPAAADSTWEGFQNDFSETIVDLVIVAYGRLANGSDPDQAVSINNDWFTVAGDRGYIRPQQVQEENGLTNYLHAHSEGELGNNIVIDPTKEYEWWIRFNGTGATGDVVLLDNGTPSGSTEVPLAGPSGVASYLQFCNYLQNRQGFARFYVFGLNWTSATWPPRSFTVPAPTSIVAAQVNLGIARLTIVSVATRLDIDSNEDGAGWVAEETNLYAESVTTTKTIDISGLAAGSDFQFRARNIMCGLESSNTTSNTITMVSPFVGTWGTGLSVGSNGSSELGKRGVKIEIGSVGVSITHLGAWFLGVGQTYTDVDVAIWDETLTTEIVTVTIPHAGSTPNAYNYEELPSPVLLDASTVYFVLRSVAGYNEFPQGGSFSYNSSVATYLQPSDGEGNNPGGGESGYGVSFQFSVS